MKMIIVALFALAAVATAAPPVPSPDRDVQVVRSDFHKDPEGSYQLYLETSNGAIRQEIGELKEVLNEENKPVLVLVVRGSYSTLDVEGHPQTISFTADENGFQASGDGIPKAPEPSRR